MRERIQSIEKKFGVKLEYSSDKKMYESLKKARVPSLVKLLRFT